ncbi:MAG: M1 family metallopeptidase [Bacteroidales bacterium]|nr:M1 family metallopeptidase [Bacteroidales bacterium]
MRILLATIGFFICINIAAQQDEEIVALWFKGVDYINAKDYLNSASTFEEFLRYYPDDPLGRYNYGLSLQMLGDQDGACREYFEASFLGYNKKNVFREKHCDTLKIIENLKENYYRSQKLDRNNNFRPTYSKADTLRGALRAERTCFDVTFYNLTVRVFPLKHTIQGYNAIHFKVLENTQTIQLDLFESMAIDSITYQEIKLDYTRDYNAVFVKFPGILQLGTWHKITVYYSGKPVIAPDPPWDGGLVWARDKRMRPWIGVACQHIGASLWWPLKDHLSDEPDSMQLNIETPKKHTIISNGTLRNKEFLPDNFQRWEWFVQYPINSYNTTFYLGNYVEITDSVKSGNKWLKCKYYALDYNEDIARDYFKQANEVIEFYSKLYGEFPFIKDGFGMVESPYEGMEHQTVIAYGDAYDNEATASFYVRKDYDYVIVHEVAHEWWGNSVSIDDMAEAWLHEGFATYSEFLFLEHKHGHQTYLEEVLNHEELIYNFWPLVENRDVNENSFASNDIYTKGAMVLHCLRGTINDDSLFFKILYDFNFENRYSVINSEDFIQTVNKMTGKNYKPFFKKYLYDNRLPVLNYKYGNKDGDLKLTYQWTQVEDGFFMPFSIETGNGEIIRLEGNTDNQEVVLPNNSTFRFLIDKESIVKFPKNGFTYYWTKMETEFSNSEFDTR